LKEGKIDVAIPASAWVRGVRIRTAVIAAPTLGFTLTPAALTAVTAPMQLWRAGRDEAFHRTFRASVVAFFTARLASR
jgi:predicted dienelactone hydrolase